MPAQEDYQSQITGFPQTLITLDLLSETDAIKAIEQSQAEGISFVTYLVNHKLVNYSTLARTLSEEFGFPLIERIEFNPDIIKLLNKKLLEQHKVLPLFKREQRLFVAIFDPTNLDALDEIQIHTKTPVEPMIAEADKLEPFIERALNLFDETELDDGELEDDVDEKTIALLPEVPVVKLVNSLLFKAIKMGGSELHFEPYDKFYRVRFRVDGVLRVVAKPTSANFRKMVARIKLMSHLDVDKQHVPQKGRIKVKISTKKYIDFLVITCPSLWGENIVMRIIDSSPANLNIDILGFDEEQKQLYLQALANPHGMILVTGPTGSGKTISLYTGINILNKEDVKISTAEETVEINLPGVNHLQIDEKNGITFAEAIRTFIAQGTDIIVVSEIRDIETAQLAIKAAQSGQMILSTRHTNDTAPQTLTRLVHIGISPFEMAEAVRLVIAQRLCRRLCRCKIEQEIPEMRLQSLGFDKDEISELKLYGPGGCEECGGSGYKGRVGIYQVMPISEAMKHLLLIMEGRNAIALADQARNEGIADLRESGLKKVKEGLTSLEELDRVIKN
ncbi:general secretion pathway protein GspE [Candidatus Thiomargarita nelsonii]|uniref:General secretion pathway protein GspE n=1 Tax=Candidatus Thiomargarita nelsonii TaxID=1003181 RepID=A0A0A6PA62_9GAMM|nr:general secretion pathway protein GspE [Candidatus Thiomargarita nelsonii]